MKGETAYRVATGIALGTAFVIVWMSAAAGLVGIEDDDPANLMYVGVLAVTFLGVLIARLRPLGMARALVGPIALSYPNTASAMAIALLNGSFAALFAGSALLFRHAAPGDEP